MCQLPHWKVCMSSTEWCNYVVLRLSPITLDINYPTRFCVTPGSQMRIKRKCNWYFIVKAKEGNALKHAGEDRLGLSPESAPDLHANKNILCAGQITWHGGVKQRAATARTPSTQTHQPCERHTSVWQEPHCRQEPSLSEQCESLTRNNASNNVDWADTRCPLWSQPQHSCRDLSSALLDQSNPAGTIDEQWLKSMCLFLQTRMQCLQPDPNAQYRSVYGALKRIIQTEGIFRPLRGLNITMMGAGPAHALYFACYERVKRSLSDVIQSGGNSHLANGMSPYVFTQVTCLSY